MKALFFLALLLPLPLSAQSAETEVRAVIDRMFEALRQQDTAGIRATFHPEFRLAVTTFLDGQPSIRQIDGNTFIGSVGRATERLDEQITDVQIRVHDNLAAVWNRYNFFIGDRLDHCGVDAFIVVRTTEGWRILQVADTQSTEGCAPF